MAEEALHFPSALGEVGGDALGVPDLIIRGGTTYRIIADQVGSVRRIVEVSTGAVAQELTYSPFGKVLSDSSPGWQPFAYAGGLYDTDTKLVRFGARDYDAEVGRWTAKDPAGFKGGLNVFVYVEADPVNFVDPHGKWLIAWPVAVEVGAYALVAVAAIGAAINSLFEDEDEEEEPCPGEAAEAARDAAGQQHGRRHATYVGGHKDGQVVAGCSGNPSGCAEDDVARQLGPDANMTKAKGWRRNPATGDVEWTEIPVCKNCQGKYSPSQFPPGTPADPGGAWGR